MADLVRPTRRPSEAWQVALYGLFRWAGQGLAAIARRMGFSYSAVSRRVSVMARVDRRFAGPLTKVLDVKIKR